MDKKRILFLFLCILIGIFLSTMGGGKEKYMALKMETTGIVFDFGTTAPRVSGYTQSTHLFWLYTTVNMSSGAPSVHQISLRGLGGSNNGWQYAWNPNVSGQLQLSINWTTTDGLWRAPTVSTNQMYMITISYNGSSTSNTPVVTYNKVSQTVTTVTTPVGSYGTADGGLFQLGDDIGILYSYAIFNRILSSDEIAEAYNNKLAIPNKNGLIFYPTLIGAGGLQNFDGVTLSASNPIVDSIDGLVGTPNGSGVVGVADNFLNFK